MLEALKEICTGCGACRAACAAGAISMRADRDGFWMPEVDPERCVRCGECEKICPLTRPAPEDRRPPAYAAYHRDAEERLRGSSGGVFWLLAAEIVAGGRRLWRGVRRPLPRDAPLRRNAGRRPGHAGFEIRPKRPWGLVSPGGDVSARGPACAVHGHALPDRGRAARENPLAAPALRRRVYKISNAIFSFSPAASRKTRRSALP